MNNEPPRCGDAGGLTKTGQPCRCQLNLDPASGLCLMHDPERAAERRACVKAGGEAPKGPARRRVDGRVRPLRIPPKPRNLEAATRLAAWVTHEVLKGTIDQRTADAAIRAVRQFQSSFEKLSLLHEVKELRAELNAAQQKTHRASGGPADVRVVL